METQDKPKVEKAGFYFLGMGLAAYLLWYFEIFQTYVGEHLWPVIPMLCALCFLCSLLVSIIIKGDPAAIVGDTSSQNELAVAFLFGIISPFSLPILLLIAVGLFLKELYKLGVKISKFDK